MALPEKLSISTTVAEAMPIPVQPLRAKVSKKSSEMSCDTDFHAATTSVVIQKKPSNPFSKFHGHPDPFRPSEDRKTPADTSHLSPDYYDLEAGFGTISKTSTAQPKVSIDGRVKECTMWPSKQSLIEKERERKRRQGGWWNVMTNMNKKQKLWFRTIVVLLFVAAAVGIGVGVSRAVGGGVWAGNGKTKNIDSN